MAYVIRKYKAIKPFPFMGRYVCTNEILRLDDATAEELLDREYIKLAEVPVILEPGKWTELTQR